MERPLEIGSDTDHFFVLDVANDPYARTAMVAYANAVIYEDAELARHLLEIVDQYDDQG